MYTPTLFAVSAMLASVFAAPAVNTFDTRAAAEIWSVTGYSFGCSPGGCTYEFNISKPKTPGVPAFNTTCGGVEKATGIYQPCSDPNLTVEIIGGLNSYTLHIEHIYSGGPTFTTNGYYHHDFDNQQPTAFTIKPNSTIHG